MHTMSRRRTLPAPVLVIAAAALASPLVLLYGSYRSLYPLVLLIGMALRAVGGRVLRAMSLLLAVLLGPFVWYLGAEGGAAETFAVLRDVGMDGVAEYARQLVIAP